MAAPFALPRLLRSLVVVFATAAAVFSLQPAAAVEDTEARSVELEWRVGIVPPRFQFGSGVSDGMRGSHRLPVAIAEAQRVGVERRWKQVPEIRSATLKAIRQITGQAS